MFSMCVCYVEGGCAQPNLPDWQSVTLFSGIQYTRRYRGGLAADGVRTVIIP